MIPLKCMACRRWWASNAGSGQLKRQAVITNICPDCLPARFPAVDVESPNFVALIESFHAPDSFEEVS